MRMEMKMLEGHIDNPLKQTQNKITNNEENIKKKIFKIPKHAKNKAIESLILATRKKCLHFFKTNYNKIINKSKQIKEKEILQTHIKQNH